jgi:DNA-binding GntR family transcriptional regulator
MFASIYSRVYVPWRPGGYALTVARQTSREYVADHLRHEILGGRLSPGEKLGVVEVAERLGVSQTPVREALQLLASEGIVRLSAYRGATVAELSSEEFEEIFVMRVALEELATRLGTAAIDEFGIDAMRAALDAMHVAAEARDVDAFLGADREFHRAHYLASGRESLWERIISIRHAAERYSRISHQLPGVGMPETVASHERIIEAVRRGDVDRAAYELVQDFRGSYDAVRQVLLAGSDGRSGAAVGSSPASIE